VSEIVYSNLEEMARRLPEDVFRVFSGFEKALADVMLDKAVEGEKKRTPVGEGTLLDSFAVDKQDSRYTAGFTDPKANALDKGRKRSKPFSRQIHAGAEQRGRRGRLLGAHGTAPYTRMLGSKQPNAGRGMTVSTGFSLRAQWPEILTEAANRAGGTEPE
jgi:hypothetical protein